MTAQAAIPSGGKLAVNALIYGLATVLSRAASLIMLPVYTRLLTPADYGLLHFLDLMVEVAVILCSAGMTMGVLRFYFKAETTQARNEVLVSAFVLQLGLDLVATVLVVAAAVPISNNAMGGAATPGMIALAGVNITIGSLAIVPLLKMQADQRATAYVAVSLAKLLLQLGLNLLFLIGLKMGPIGILWSNFASSLVVGVGMSIWMLRDTGMKVTRPALRDLRRFGVPYQFMAAGSFILAFGDRFVLEPVAGLAVVGIYSLAYQFGMLGSAVAAAPFLRAWNPIRFEQVTTPLPERDAAADRGFRHLNLVTVSFAVGVALFVRPLLMVMSDPAFHGAVVLVPVILFAYQLQTWTEAARFGIDASEQTRYASYAVWVSAVVCIALYFVLIPPFGAMGAAVATVLAFWVRFHLTYRWAQRLFPIGYRWGPTVRLTVLAALVVIPVVTFPPASLALAVGAGTIGALVYVLVGWRFVVVGEDRAWIRHAVTAAPLAFLRRIGVARAA